MTAFFSIKGGCSRPVFLAWFAVALGLTTIALLLVAQIGGYAASVAAGLLAGGAIAKLRSVWVRRLRSAGLDTAWIVGLNLAVPTAVIFALLQFVGYGPDSIFTFLLIAAAGIVLLSGLLKQRAPTSDVPDRSGMIVAMFIIVASCSLGYAAAAWSDRLGRMNRDIAERAANYVPPPDPLGNADTPAQHGGGTR